MRRTSRITLVFVLGAVVVVLAGLIAWGRLGDTPPDHNVSPPDGPIAASPVPTPPASSASRDPAGASLSVARPRENAAGASSSDPADAAFVESWGEPTAELLRASIEAVVDDVFVDRALSPAELERATGALLTLRTLRAELDALPMEPAHAARRRELVEALGRASASFHEVLGMSPSEFTTRAAHAMGEAAGSGGIDRDLDPDYVPDDDFLPPRDAEASEP